MKINRKVSISAEVNLVYSALVKFVKEYKYAPSMKELSQMTGVTTRRVSKAIIELECNGYISRKKRSPRAISVKELSVL